MLLPQPAACEALMTSTVPSVRACTYTPAVEHESQCTQMVAAGFDCETWCATILWRIIIVIRICRILPNMMLARKPGRQRPVLF